MDSQPQINAEPRPPYSGQKLAKPGIEENMQQKPRWYAPRYRPANKLEGKVALITGGDSGIGRAVAYLYAREGADIALSYLTEEQIDADVVIKAIEKLGRKCFPLPGDLREASFCRELVEKTVSYFGKLDILVSNASWQNRNKSIDEISQEDWRRTFQTNIDAYFYLTQAALKHMKVGSSIIATSSETAILGSEHLLDYSTTKAAIIAFSKSLAQNVAGRGIRVNVVAPGPVWSPLNPADTGMSKEDLERFGSKQPYKRAAQPEEIAPAYVFLASDADSSYISGIVLEEMGAATGAA